MRKPIKLWLEALRSGKYKQGTGSLKKKNRYCCLGIGIELYNKHHKQKVQFPSLEKRQDLALSSGLIRVRKWLKLCNGVGGIKNGCCLLASMNDCGDSFKKIANFIEKNIERLTKK